jgi:DNA-binding CsgD family transcriptional regulator
VIPEPDEEVMDASNSKPLALTALQERALQQLAAGTSIMETARVMGVHRRMVH